MAHLVGCCVCVCCVLCFVLQPMTRQLYLFFWLYFFPVLCVLCFVFCAPTEDQTTVPFFSGRNFFQFCNNWCLCFDTTDSYLRFISTLGQTTVPFFPVVFFSCCNLNPPKSIAVQTTVPFFPVVFFSGRKYNNWCSCQITNTNYDPKKLRPEKKGTVIWPAMFFKSPEKITTRKKRYSRLTDG
jgi:hypothetical protein